MFTNLKLLKIKIIFSSKRKEYVSLNTCLLWKLGSVAK